MEIQFRYPGLNCHSPVREAQFLAVRRLVGLLLVAALIATAVAVASASAGATRAPAHTPKLSPVAPFFSLLPPQPQKPKQAPTLPAPMNGYSCAVATGSRCSSTPCTVFVAPGSSGTFHLVPGSRSCTGAASPIPRATPINAR